LNAEAISWSIILGSGTLSSLHKIRRLSAMLAPVVGVGAGLASFCWFRGGTVSHCLDGVGPFAVDMALGTSVGAGLSAGARFGSVFGFGSGFGIGPDLGSLSGCSC